MNRGGLCCLFLGLCLLLQAQDNPGLLELFSFNQVRPVVIELCEENEKPGWALPPGAVWKKQETFSAAQLAGVLESTQQAAVEKQNRSFLLIRPAYAAQPYRLSLSPVQPPAIEGQALEIAFMYRSNTDLELKVVIEDTRGIVYKLPVTLAEAAHWVCYKLAVPPFIDQVDFFKPGSSARFRGFELVVRKAGSELALDLVTARCDFFQQENRDPDYMENNW